MENFGANVGQSAMTEAMKLIQALIVVSEQKKVTETDKRELNDASNYISNLSSGTSEQFPAFLTNLSDILAGRFNIDRVSPTVRQQAGLQLKNQIGGSSHKIEVRKAYRQRWLNLDETTRNHIKNNVLVVLGQEEYRPSAAAQCIQFIAAAELPGRLWPTLISQLGNNIVSQDVNGQNNETKIEASLNALGYVCQEVSEINHSCLEENSNIILTSIMHGVKYNSSNNDSVERIRLAAANALLNSLIIARASFEKENERNYIMQVVCESTRSESKRISTAALECLSRIMSLYYHYMEPYMAPALFPITLEAMNSKEDDVAMQGIDFWSSVCEEEMNLAEEADVAEAGGEIPENVSKFYAKGALQYIMPVLMKNLAKEDEFDDDDEWNPSSASSMCISLLATCCKDDIIPHVLPFVESNINNSDWRQREAAIQAFGSIIDGPDPETLGPIVSKAMPFLVQGLNETNVAIKNTAAWTIGRACDVTPDATLEPESLQSLLEALVRGLSAETRIAVKICWTIRSVSEAAYESAAANMNHVHEFMTPDTYSLSPFFQQILEKLIEASKRPDKLDSSGGHGTLQLASYKAIQAFVCNSPKDCYQSVKTAVIAVLKQLQETLATLINQSNRADITESELTQTNKFLTLLCSTLQRMFKKIRPADATDVAEPAMEAILKMLQISMNPESIVSKLSTSTLQEDSMELLSTLAELVADGFSKYVQVFLPFVQLGLKRGGEDPLVCLAAIDACGDIAQALGADFVPYCNDITKALLEIIADENVPKDIKPRIIATFGRFAAGLKTNFTNYYTTIFPIIEGACAMTNKSEEDDSDYRNDLREACMDAYIGLIQGMKLCSLYQPEDPSVPIDSSNLRALVPYLSKLCQFLHTVGIDLDRSTACLSMAVKLIGIVCMSFKQLVAESLNTNTILAILEIGKRSRSNKVRDKAAWAQQELSKLGMNSMVTNKSCITDINSNFGNTIVNTQSISMD